MKFHRISAVINWRTSSHSGNGQDCVEVAAGWCTSSYSTNGQNCVEVRPGQPAVGVRDSKNRTGGELAVSPTAWRAFVRSVRS